MVLVIITDRHPITAIHRLMLRAGFMLFPTSLLLMKYYTDVGLLYLSDGNHMVAGVSTNKTSLDLIVFVVTLRALWNFQSLISHKDIPDRHRRSLPKVPY